jgi:hypothetical protein
MNRPFFAQKPPAPGRVVLGLILAPAGPAVFLLILALFNTAEIPPLAEALQGLALGYVYGLWIGTLPALAAFVLLGWRGYTGWVAYGLAGLMLGILCAFALSRDNPPWPGVAFFGTCGLTASLMFRLATYGPGPARPREAGPAGDD